MPSSLARALLEASHPGAGGGPATPANRGDEELEPLDDARLPPRARPLAPTSAEIAEAYARARRTPADAWSVESISDRIYLNKDIIEYRVRPSRGLAGVSDEYLVGKVYPCERRSAEAYRLLSYAWRHGLGGEGGYGMSRPLAHLPHRCTVLMTRAPGWPLDRWLEQRAEAGVTAPRVADWLARMHRVRPPPFPVDRELRVLRRPDRLIDELVEALPSHGPRIARLGEAIRAARERVARLPQPPVLLHGDLHPGNLFVDDAHVTAIDFDHAAVGDPATELAYLSTQLELPALRAGDAAAIARDRSFGRVLRESYQDRMPLAREGLGARLAGTRALVLLESLHYDVVILRVRRPAEEVVLIDAAEASAGELEGDGRR